MLPEEISRSRLKRGPKVLKPFVPFGASVVHGLHRAGFVIAERTRQLKAYVQGKLKVDSSRLGRKHLLGPSGGNPILPNLNPTQKCGNPYCSPDACSSGCKREPADRQQCEAFWFKSRHVFGALRTTAGTCISWM